MLNYTNYSCAPRPGILWGNAVIGAVMYIIVLITFFGNLLVMIAVYRERKLKTAFNFLIVNLAITDITLSVTAMPFYATNKMLGYWPFGRVMCAFWIFCDYGMTFASVFTLVFISCDRFWSVFWSHSYRLVNKKKKSLVMIAIVWCGMLILWTPAMVMDRLKSNHPSDECFWNPAQNRKFVFVIATLGHHGPCVTLLFFYFGVFFYLRAKMKMGQFKKAKSNQVSPLSAELNEVRFTNTFPGVPNTDNGSSPATHFATTTTVDNPATDQTSAYLSRGSNTSYTKVIIQEENLSAVTNQHPSAISTISTALLHVPGQKESWQVTRMDNKRSSREIRVFVTLTYIIIGYLICWVPFHVTFDVFAADPDLVPEVVFDVAFWMSYTNSTINPFLYHFSNPDFRNAFKRIALGKKNMEATSTLPKQEP